MNWIWLLAGLFFGYMISWLIEWFSWKDRRVCAEAEDQLRSQLTGLESRNHQLEADYASYEQSAVKVSDLEGRLRAKDLEVSKLQTSYEASASKLKAVESGDLGSINTKGWDWGKLALATGGGALAGYIAKDSGEYKDMEGQIKSLKGERDSLSAELKTAKAGAGKTSDLEAKIKTLEVERKNLSAKVDSLEANAGASADLQTRIAELEGERDSLNAKVGSLEASAGSSSDLEARIAELEGERDGLSAQMNAIQSGDVADMDTSGWDWGKLSLAAGAGALAATAVSDSDEYKEIEGQVSSLTEERDALNARIAAMEANDNSADLEAQIAAAQSERDALQAKLDAAASDTSVADLEAQLAALQAERDGLQGQLDAAANDTSAADLEARLAALQGERDELNVKLGAAESYGGTLEARIAELEKGNKANLALAAAGAAAAGGAGYFAGRDWRKLEVGTPELGNFSIDANDVATGKFALSGTAEAGADVAVQVGETVIGRTRVGDDNSWQYSDVIRIPAGVHEVWARMVDPEDGRTAMEAKSRSIKLQRRPSKPDDLTKLWGIGPKFNELLQSKGITTFVQLSTTEVEKIRTIITESDMKARLANEETWPEQARLAANGDWDGLKKLTADYAERRRSGEFGDD